MGQGCIAKSEQKGQRKEEVGQGRRKSSKTSCCTGYTATVNNAGYLQNFMLATKIYLGWNMKSNKGI